LPDDKTSQEGTENQDIKANNQPEQETEETAVGNRALKEGAVSGAGETTGAEPSVQDSSQEQPGEDTGDLVSETSELSDENNLSGALELCIEKSVNLRTSIELFTYLQTIAELKIIRTQGSLDNSITITLTIDKPVPLVDLIKMRIKDIEVTSEPPNKDAPAVSEIPAERTRLTVTAK